MPKKAEDKSLNKKAVSKKRNSITICGYMGGECPCTNLNGSGCTKKQETDNCLHKKLGPKQEQKAA